MLGGTGASTGIGIGTAVVVEETELVITRQAVEDVLTEVERFNKALDQTWRKRSGDHAGACNAFI